MSDPVASGAFEAAADIVDLYDRRSSDWIADRGSALTDADRAWLDRFTTRLSPGDAVLDVGCGSRRPMAAALLERGFRVTGVDSSARRSTRANSRRRGFALNPASGRTTARSGSPSGMDDR